MVSSPPAPAPTPERLTAEVEMGDFLEAAGLLSYDPAAITRIYAGHPMRLVRRVWQTLVPIGLYLLGVGFDKFTGQLANPGRARQRARVVCEPRSARSGDCPHTA